MGVFDKFKKKEDVIDYTDKTKYAFRKAPTMPRPKTPALPSPTPSSSFTTPTNTETNPISFLGELAQASPTSEVSSIEDPKERLKQRLLSMTEQIEDLSNQLYRINQRLEFLEQKLKSGRDYLG